MKPFKVINPISLARAEIIDLPDWHTWCASMVSNQDGKYHLIFSRWPRNLGFDAWATHSQFAYATAQNPQGPFQIHGTILGPDDLGAWDSGGFHNPCLIFDDGRYYLYYTGQHGNGQWWNHRNNQRVGVAVASHPSGPWERFPEPLIHPQPDHILTGTPNVIRRLDGKFQMVYKTVTEGPRPFGGSVHHKIAVSDSPLGPFENLPLPFITNPKSHFPIDDHLEWIQNDSYYALVKDNTGEFTGEEAALILFTSHDGYHWTLASDPIVVQPQVEYTDGSIHRCKRLEMPKLFFQDNKPTYLLLSVLPEDSDHSFTIIVPLL